MGIKNLMKFINEHAPKSVKEVKMGSFTGQYLAIDASMCLYQFLIAIRDSSNAAMSLTNEHGQVTSHLQGFLSRTLKMLEAGVKPVYVFDGKPPELKLEELAKRRELKEDAEKQLAEAQETGDMEMVRKIAGRTVRVSKEQTEQVKTLLRLMGLPVIEAPSEAEASCAELARKGKCYAAVAEDMDCLTFGAARQVRHFFAPEAQKRPIIEVNLQLALDQLDCTMDEFIDFCILSGCDYCDTIRGIGAESAFRLIKKHGSIEKVLEEGLEERFKVPEHFPYKESRRIFKEIEVVDASTINMVATTPDYDALTKFLVEENNFNAERIKKSIDRLRACKGKATQCRLDSFFTIKAPTIKSDEKFDPFKKKGGAKAKAKGTKRAAGDAGAAKKKAR